MRFKPLWIPFLFVVLVGSLLVALEPQRQEAASGKTPVAAHRSLPPSYGKLPLSFEVNQGQTDRRVKFLSHGHGCTLFITPTETVLALSKSPPQTELPDPSEARIFRARKIMTTALRIKLMGGNPQARLAGMEKLPGKSNYFIGNDPKQWRTNVPSYARVKYRDVYPGVDLVYHGNQRELEYDFVVAPGGDPQAIALRVQGADHLEVDAQGDLVLHTAVGPIRQRKPVIYQEVNGVRREIAGGYVLQGTRKVGFQVAAYDPGRPLVIDPTLVYSTYLGSGQVEDFGIAVDALGSAYVTGTVFFSTFPTTAGAFQPTFDGRPPAFVTKLNAAGSALVYSTFLGGSVEGDIGLGIAVDALGNAYVTGSTFSTTFPTTPGAFQTTPRGRINAFVTKLNPTGSALVYSTYLGGGDVGHGIAVDALGSAYVTGSAGFPTFPTTPGAFQTALRGNTGAFVTKLDPLGSFLVYSTFLSSSANDVGNGIAVDALGNAHVTGFTESTDFPTTAGAFQPACPPTLSPCRSAFVTKLNSLGSALVYSTRLGGSPPFTGDIVDSGNGIALDALGNAYVIGSTPSTTFPTTAGAFQPTFSSSFSNAFVTKLNAAGSALVYSTYMSLDGPRGFTLGIGIAVDALGNAYVTGFQGSPLPFVAKVNPSASGAASLVYATFLTGPSFGFGRGQGIAVDALGNAYVTGFTAQNDFPTTAGAFQTTSSGESGFVTKIGPVPAVSQTNLTFTPASATTSDFDDPATVQAELTKTSDGSPVPSEMITFTLGSGSGAPTCSATTDATGTATCSLTPNQPAGPQTLTADFAGDSTFGPSSASTNFAVTKEETVTKFTATSPTLLANGMPATFSATLKEDGATAISGRTLTFTLGSGAGARSCSGASDASGTASCSIVVNQPLGPNTIKVDFAGDSFFRPSSDTKAVFVFAFLGGGGSFVIGDLNAVVGNAVTFWGAQWAKVNSLSGGPAPDAFKGFADMTSTAPPTCGGTFMTDPGNSAPPPATVPPFMAVIASSSITQSGPTISGNVPKIVIVQTNPGYGPSPGQTGTGTVVAVLCP